MIRLSIASTLFSLMLLATQANAETWCLKIFGQERSTCVFSSVQDCSQAARFSAFGGMCEREAFRRGNGDQKSRSGRRAGSAG